MITVALPIWQMHDIMWLQLEALCRQENAGEWELIISECNSNFAHILVQSEYQDRLADAGMTRYRYIYNKKRIPLGLKWRQIAREATGDIMLLCAGDNYSPPNRLALAREYIGEYDWFDVSSGLFYDIGSGETGQWVRKHKWQSGLWMATKTRYMKELGSDPPNKSIDGWVKKHLPDNFRWKQHHEPLNGLHTDGRNTISNHRAALYNQGGYNRNFDPTKKQDLFTCIPPEVFEKI